MALASNLFFLRNLRISDVELFITAAQMKHLGKAALFHHVSQSGASAAIQRLEGALGMDLCTHEKRRFCLTRTGELLLPKLNAWLKELCDSILSQDKASLRFVTTHAIAQVVVPSLLSLDNITFQYMRLDDAYGAILHDQADIALVLDNAPWKGVVATEVGKGYFQIVAKTFSKEIKPILIPENQRETRALQERWQQEYGSLLPIKARIPSWSLIATICSHSSETGFLPDFLSEKFKLHPVSWQPNPFSYKILAIYRAKDKEMASHFTPLLDRFHSVFSGSSAQK